ncbi:SulP family inorganic anion transporter [Emticicia sp. C21]|uniref:SulP family inorganic anion transporter n=1 Tax=Emticicia sp. C21 TaxID=2302915 RepID=UPI000E351FE1|nr:SulP family inorganic anion transporter [Emticicia sp. C21]RFS14524.1 SulP family inorganic anion transporter [Emticicia sp. C21]
MKSSLNFSNLKHDFPAGVVVFLVALPLCLGIALASGAPLLSGVIAGIIGGIVVGAISGSQVGVAGPAAGLTVIVLNSITELGAFESFTLAVVLAGFIQIILGAVKAGVIGYYFPSSVIKGMLTAIGIIIILKQIPHVFGIDQDYEGDENFVQKDGENTFSELLNITHLFNEGALIIGVVSLLVLIIWDMDFIKRNKVLSIIPGPLLAVFVGVFLNSGLSVLPSNFHLENNHLVNLPIAKSFSEFTSFLAFPNFSAITNPLIWKTAFVIAVVASLETLLSVEATDKLDPQSRITPTNRELIAQGSGNIVSGLVGGLPITQVIVRSSANIQSGSKSKLSAIIHGIILMVCTLSIPSLLNLIPLASLAAVLIMVGYKLAKPSMFKSMFKEGPDQFVPFIITVLAVVFTDLLTGIGIGVGVAMVYILYTNYKGSMSVIREDKNVLIQFNKDIFYFNKSELMQNLASLRSGDQVVIDGSKTTFIDHDIFLTLEEFQAEAKARHINIEFKNIKRRKLNYRKSDGIVSKTLISE